jgi:threonine dehydrogenase-like Zn-dependent dehydrogenase
MGQTMKAFVMKQIGQVGVMEKSIPEPGPTDAIIKTTAALICTSDTHTVAGAIGERTNLTLGHEAVGVIHKLGSAVHGFKEGDRVVVNAITPCFQCENCLRGYTSQCTQTLGGWKFANIKATRAGGTISNVGYHGHGEYLQIPRVDWGVGMSDKTIRTGLCPGGAERMKRLMRLLETGRVDPTPLTSHRFKFAEIEKAFQMMQTKEDGMLKPLILFG